MQSGALPEDRADNGSWTPVGVAVMVVDGGTCQGCRMDCEIY